MSIALRREDGPSTSWGVLQISDTGPGIPEQYLPKVFIPFFTNKQGGVGMGLPLARKIAMQHGGQLTLESSAGEGTTVVLRLPLLSGSESTS